MRGPSLSLPRLALTETVGDLTKAKISPSKTNVAQIRSNSKNSADTRR